jgi:hypothetical protein
MEDLMISKKIGKNPFAGLFLSTITCVKCGPKEELHRWEVQYDINVEVKPTLYESLNQNF